MRKGDAQEIRRLNRRALLESLRQAPATRADLARKTGLAKSAVSRLVEELLEEGLLEEGEVRPRELGRPWVLLRLKPRARHALGAELGVEGTVLLALDWRGEVLWSQEWPHPKEEEVEARLEALKEVVWPVHVVYGIPIVTLIFRNYYSEIPDELVEAARIDGAGFFGIFRHVILPLSIPGFVVVGIWQFTQIWNEFLFAVTLTRPESQPITVALAQLAGGEAVKWNLPMAGAILAALPTLLVYIFLGRYFLRGLLAGSVKG